MTRRHVLLVAYHFPPLAGPGTFRPLRLAKYLPRRGWDVTVVSVSPRVRLPKDPGLLADVPASVPVVRTRTLEPRDGLIALNRLGLVRATDAIERFLMVPDDQRGWAPFAAAAARRVRAERPLDAVITTSAPYSAHLVGAALRRAGVPWVADFRDPWTENPYLSGRYPTAWHRALNRRLEARVLREADRVVSVSAPCVDALRRGSPGLPDAKFAVLPNGFDPDHFAGPPPPRPERFRVVYTGTFYGLHSPRAFLDALRLVLADGRVREDDVEVLFVGQGAAPPAGAPVPRGVRFAGHAPHAATVGLMREAAALLLVLSAAGGPGIYTTKLFHYLAAGRPILAAVPDGVAADLVRAAGAGVVARPDDPADIADALAALYRAWRDDEPHAPRADVIAPFGADRQSADWAALLDELVTSPR